MNDFIDDKILTKEERIAMGILSICSKQSTAPYMTSYELTQRYFEILKNVKENFKTEDLNNE